MLDKLRSDWKAADCSWPGFFLWLLLRLNWSDPCGCDFAPGWMAVGCAASLFFYLSYMLVRVTLL